MFEHVHQSQLADAIFADPKTLITAGMDCTVSVWALVSTSKTVDLQPKACLFGHQAPITTLGVSRAFSTLLSASSDGQVLLWDLNRLKLVRVLAHGKTVEVSRPRKTNWKLGSHQTVRRDQQCHGSRHAVQRPDSLTFYLEWGGNT